MWVSFLGGIWESISGTVGKLYFWEVYEKVFLGGIWRRYFC